MIPAGYLDVVSPADNAIRPSEACIRWGWCRGYGEWRALVQGARCLPPLPSKRGGAGLPRPPDRWGDCEASRLPHPGEPSRPPPGRPASVRRSPSKRRGGPSAGPLTGGRVDGIRDRGNRMTTIMQSEPAD
jgi:hypothetical protein